MTRHTREGIHFRERLFRTVRLPLAASIGTAAILGSQTHTAIENIYALPLMTTEGFDAHDALRASVTTDPLSPRGYSYESNKLPPLFAMAFENALHDPIVQIGIHEDAMDAIDVYLTSGDDAGDNGYWYSQDRRVALLVSGNDLPPHERLFDDSRLVNIALEHETFHALNEEWYGHKRLNGASDTDRYSSLLQLADQQFDNGLNATFSQIGSLCGPDSDTSDHTYDLGCINSTLLMRLINNSYKCIDEGYALQGPFDWPTELPMGHPYDNLTETGSSLLTSLNNNPTYVRECLSDTSNTTGKELRKLAATIIRLAFAAHPPLETYFREDSDKADTVDWILETA